MAGIWSMMQSEKGGHLGETEVPGTNEHSRSNRPSRSWRGPAKCVMSEVVRRKDAGQALVEFALIVPLLFILIVNVLNFAGYFYAFIEVGNASRSAGDYTIMGSVAYSGTDASGAAGPPFTSPSDQGSAGALLVANVLATDMSTLPSLSSLAVRVCTLTPSNAAIGNATCNVCTSSNNTGSMSCASGSGSFSTNPSPDTSTGEGGQYRLTWVDVSYTYTPFVPLSLQFPGGFRVTLPNNLVIHRQSVYRILGF